MNLPAKLPKAYALDVGYPKSYIMNNRIPCLGNEHKLCSCLLRSLKLKAIFFIALSLLFATTLFAQVGISSTSITPNSSSILELRSTTLGFLPPRMTTTERDAISSPATGLLIYNTTTNLLNFYNGSSWQISASGSVSSVSVTTANGISGTVANATSTPAISLTLGAITPSSVAATGTVTGSNLSGTNTGDQTITLTGDITGTGTGSFATTLPTVNSNVGTFNNVTVNGKGQVTAASNVSYLTSADLSGYELLSNKSTTTTLGTSNTLYPTQNAVKTYVDNGLAAKQASGSYLVSTNNLSDVGSAATTRTNLGATTIGSNLFTLTNPSAITFPRYNADNTVSALDASSFRTAIGAGTSSASGTVTSVSIATANGFAGTVATATTTPAITLSTSITGLLKGNGTAISAATSGTDYSAGTSALATGILKSTTTTGALSIAVAGDFPTLNQNTTGTAANVTGIVSIANGGTGQTTASAAFDAISPMTALGDLIYGGAAGTDTRLAGNTTATKQFLSQTGNGSVSSAPVWQQPAVADLSDTKTGTGSIVLATSPTFTGTPTLPTGTIATTQTAGNNTTAIATTAFVTAINNNASYRTILNSAGSHTAAKAAGTYAMGYGDPIAVSGTGTLYPIATIYIAAADYPTVNGITTKLRIRAQLYTNDVAPTGNFTFGLYPITRPTTSGGAGLNIYTLGTVVTGSNGATFTAPAVDGLLQAVGSDFAIPADGFYVIGVITTNTVANNSHLHMNAQLQMRNN